MKKIIGTIIISIIILSMSMLNVYSIKSVSMRISPSKGEVKQGEIISFTFSTTDLQLDANEQGLGGISGYVDISENVFENLAKDSFEGLNGWKVETYNPNNGMIILSNVTVGVKSGDVFKLTTKLKSNATLGITQIKLKNVTVSTEALTEYELATEVVTQVNVAASAIVTSPSPSPTPSTAIVNPYSSPSPSPSIVPSTVPVNITPSTVPTTKPTTSPTASTNNSNNIPHAGSENLIIPAMIIVAIFAIVMYTKYKKLD